MGCNPDPARPEGDRELCATSMPHADPTAQLPDIEELREKLRTQVNRPETTLAAFREVMAAIHDTLETFVFSSKYRAEESYPHFAHDIPEATRLISLLLNHGAFPSHPLKLREGLGSYSEYSSNRFESDGEIFTREHPQETMERTYSILLGLTARICQREDRSWTNMDNAEQSDMKESAAHALAQVEAAMRR